MRYEGLSIEDGVRRDGEHGIEAHAEVVLSVEELHLIKSLAEKAVEEPCARASKLVVLLRDISLVLCGTRYDVLDVIEHTELETGRP